MKIEKQYVAFLRGINVGGHHKVPMAELRIELEKLRFENIITILNSGNVIFHSNENDIETLETKMSKHLEKVFGFQIPTVIRKSETIQEWSKSSLFENVNVTKDIRLYVSLLWEDNCTQLKLPWHSSDSSYEIIEKKGQNIFSVLDLSVSGTPKAMEALEKFYGKNITTRNWNTIERIIKKLTPI